MWLGEEIRQYFLDQEQANINLVMIRYGRNFSGTGQNLGQGFIALKHWDERKGKRTPHRRFENGRLLILDRIEMRKLM